METLQFEPMSVGRIFDRAFAIYRNNFLRFVTIVAVIQVPLALFSIASDSWTQTKTASRPSAASDLETAQQNARFTSSQYDPDYAGPSPFGIFGWLFGVLLQLVGGMLCQAALIKNVSETYLGNEITIGQAYRFVLPKALTLIIATICVGLVMGFGFLLLIVPGIIFSLWFSLTTSAIVVENHSATSGMSRSKVLVAGNLGKVFGVMLIATILSYIIVLPLSYLGGFVARGLAADSATLGAFMRDLGVTLGGILVTPISAAAFILLYYDLRIRKEGFDLQMLAQSMASGQGELRAT